MDEREKFYKKLCSSFENYIQDLKKHDKEYIIKKSYETSLKEEIVSYFVPYSHYYDLDEIRLLSKSKKPLDGIYSQWLNGETYRGDDLKDAILEYVWILKNNSKDYER